MRRVFDWRSDRRHTPAFESRLYSQGDPLVRMCSVIAHAAFAPDDEIRRSAVAGTVPPPA
jgi:hypothetical protein